MVDHRLRAPHYWHMSFAARITRHPIAFDPSAGATAAHAFADLGPDFAALIAGAAGCSPYLAGLLAREGDWLRVALMQRPEDVVPDVLAGIGDPLGPALRQAKRRMALYTALADLGGVWTLEQVTGALTALADRAVDLALRAAIADEVRRGKLPEDDGTAGMVVLAMGKMGAHELNYSSDIDLICLYDDARYPGDTEVRQAFVRATRKMTSLLADITDQGYVFRTDLRLRPDASVTPVCLSMTAAEAYYESVGRTWERAAFIKARACAGDVAAGERFLKGLVPFVWRKHLDYAAIQDAHDMRLRIRDHRGLHGIAVEGHNLKLGAGGIREIEFFTQTRQLIAGGRDTELRNATTVGGLARLAEKGWVPADVALVLTDAYRAHREVEHRLQMVGDAQTHDLPGTVEGVARIAAFCGMEDASFRKGLLDRLHKVDELTDGFFAPVTAEVAPVLSDKATAIVAGWRHYPALRSDRARQIFKRLSPSLLRRLQAAANADEALMALDGFLRGLPAGVQVFSLFEANPALVDLVIDIAATAPALAAYLSRHSRVLDAVIGGAFFADWPGVSALTDDLNTRLHATEGYEQMLDMARVWQQEWHFRIGVHHLRGLIGAEEAGVQYADLAGAVLAALFPVVGADISARYGAPPGRGAVLIGMGSLGAGRLNAGSDLDLIVIYDADGQEASTGPRPLATRAYFARLTQGLVTALTAPMAQGRLYEVDMRLRPSGRQGPVATSWDAFRAYQQDEAWTWEHLALTRARVVVGDSALGAEVEVFRCALIAAKGQGAAVRGDVAEMRARLAAAKPGAAGQAKYGAGRLLDIDLVAQMLALMSGSDARATAAQLAVGQRAGIICAAEVAIMAQAAVLCWQMQAGMRLLSVMDVGQLGQGAMGFLGGQAALEALDAACAAAADVIDGLMRENAHGHG